MDDIPINPFISVHVTDEDNTTINLENSMTLSRLVQSISEGHAQSNLDANDCRRIAYLHMELDEEEECCEEKGVLLRNKTHASLLERFLKLLTVNSLILSKLDKLIGLFEAGNKNPDFGSNLFQEAPGLETTLSQEVVKEKELVKKKRERKKEHTKWVYIALIGVFMTCISILYAGAFYKHRVFAKIFGCATATLALLAGVKAYTLANFKESLQDLETQLSYLEAVFLSLRILFRYRNDIDVIIRVVEKDRRDEVGVEALKVYWDKSTKLKKLLISARRQLFKKLSQVRDDL